MGGATSYGYKRVGETTFWRFDNDPEVVKAMVEVLMRGRLFVDVIESNANEFTAMPSSSFESPDTCVGGI